MSLKSYTFGSYTRFFVPHIINILRATGDKEYWELQHKFALEKYRYHEKCLDRCRNVLNQRFPNKDIVLVACFPYMFYRMYKQLKWFDDCGNY